MRLSDAITLYLSERGPEMRPSTLSKYRATLVRLPEFHDGELADVDTVILRNYRDALIARGIKPQSVNKYLDRVRAFFQYMTDRGDIPRNPAKVIAPLDEPPPSRPRYSKAVLAALVENARNARDRAMIATSLEWLLRGGELATIRISDLDMDNLTCRVVLEKKKGEFRVDHMAVSPALAAELGQWLVAYRVATGPLSPDAYLFPRVDWRGMGTDGHYVYRQDRPCAHPYSVVGYALAAAGVPTSERAGFHDVRRSMARLRFEALADAGDADAIGVVQALLHHESRSQTEQYIGVDAARQRRNKIMQGSTWASASPLATVAEPRRAHLSLVVS